MSYRRALVGWTERLQTLGKNLATSRALHTRQLRRLDDLSTGSNEPIDPNGIAKAGVPLGRAGQAQDIANGVLSSPLRLQLHYRSGARDRRGHDRGRATSLALIEKVCSGVPPPRSASFAETHRIVSIWEIPLN